MKPGLIVTSSLATVLCLGISLVVAWNGRGVIPWLAWLPLAGLESAQFEPEAMRWSIRTFGNGGLFSFTGFFRNKSLGAYRAFVTEPHRAVVLHFAGRTVVISPATTEEFIHDLTISSQAGQAVTLQRNAPLPWPSPHRMGRGNTHCRAGASHQLVSRNKAPGSFSFSPFRRGEGRDEGFTRLNWYG